MVWQVSFQIWLAEPDLRFDLAEIFEKLNSTSRYKLFECTTILVHSFWLCFDVCHNSFPHVIWQVLYYMYFVCGLFQYRFQIGARTFLNTAPRWVSDEAKSPLVLLTSWAVPEDLGPLAHTSSSARARGERIGRLRTDRRRGHSFSRSVFRKCTFGAKTSKNNG